MNASFKLKPLCLLTLLAASVGAGADEWRYVVPSPDEPFAHPPLRLLPLDTKKPDDVKESVRYRGARQRYGQIRYGSPSSVRVTVVVDEIGANEVDLYVDTARSRCIQKSDLVAPAADGLWRMPLDVAVVEGDKTASIPRTLIFRYGKVAKTLSYATCGYLEGRARLGNHTLSVRRLDGDGNGFFADAQDRLWIDLDKNGAWDEFQEQFLCAPILTLTSTRYAVRTDALGTRLAFEKLEGAGTIRVAIPQSELAKRVVDLSATFMGRDGSVTTLRGNNAETTLPIGEYRLSVLVLTLSNGAEGGLPWNYVFSDSGGRRPKWYKLDKGGTQVIDPVGKLELRTGLADNAPPVPRGEALSVRPELYTGDGLLINTVYLGQTAGSAGYGGCSASVSLCSKEGAALDVNSSGFA